MATAEALRATHTVDGRVRGVADQVVGLDDRVAGVDHRLRDVNDTVATVNDRVATVNDRVRAVDDKVTGAVTDAQAIKCQSPFSYIGPEFRVSHVLCRKSVVGEPSQMALATRPVHQP